MTKYILVTWPEIQDYMEHPRWNECIFCMNIEGHECPDSAYMIPEDLYKEIQISKLYPAEFDISLGHIKITMDEVILNGEGYTRDISQLKKGSKVILYSLEKGYWITTCTGNAKNLPPIFEDSSTLIDCEIIGIKNEKYTENCLK